MLEHLVEARWPAGGTQLALSPLPGQCVAWSATGLIAFSSAQPPATDATSACFPIYIMTPARYNEVAVIDTGHKATIKYLEWSASGHALVSVDHTGNCALWAMKEHMSNEWECVYRHELGGEACVGVQWLDTGAETRVLGASAAGADGAYDKIYTRMTPPGPLACAGTYAFMLVTSHPAVHVVYQTPVTRDFAHLAAPLRLVSDPVQVVAIARYTGGEVLVACAHKDSVSVYEVAVTLTGAQYKLSVRGLDAIPDITPTMLFFDTLTRDLFTYSTVREGAGLLQRWHPTSKNIEANPNNVFGPDGDMQRRTEHEVSHQAECSANVCAMAMAASGDTLALLHESGVCELFSARTLDMLARSSAPSVPMDLTSLIHTTTHTTAWQSVTFSPNDACLVLVNVNGDVTVLDAFSQPNEATAFANALELSMVRRYDWWDVVACLHGRNSAELCGRVAEQLEQRFQAQRDGLKQMYLASFMALCTSVYRLERHVPSMVDANIRLLIDTCLAVFRSCVTPCPPQAPLTPARLVASLDADDASPDDLVAKLHIPDKCLEGLQPLAQWAVHCAVFLLKNIDHLVASYPTLKLARHSLPQFTSRHAIPGVSILLDLGAINKLRELLVYASYVRARAAGRQQKYMPPLLKVLSELRSGLAGNIFESIDSQGPTVACQKLQEIMAKFADWDAPFRNARFELETLLTRLNVLPDRPPVHGRLMPTGRVDLHVESRDPAKPPPSAPVAFDVVRHVAIRRGATLRQCIRCRRVSHVRHEHLYNAPWVDKWQTACVCGALWRLCRHTLPQIK